MLSTSLFSYQGSSVFLLLDGKQGLFSGCGLPVLDLPTEPHRNLTGRAQWEPHVGWMNAWKWMKVDSTYHDGEVCSQDHLYFLLQPLPGKTWIFCQQFWLWVLASQSKSSLYLKKCFFFFNIKTAYIKLEAMCSKVKVVLLCLDPHMPPNGLTSAFNPLVPEALWQIIIICVAGPGGKIFVVAVFK